MQQIREENNNHDMAAMGIADDGENDIEPDAIWRALGWERPQINE